jgi:enoyl-CoA hydratase/carnithine racemase
MEVSLHRAPANEIGTEMLADLERLADAVRAFERDGAAVLLHSALPPGFSAGADLRELLARMQPLDARARLAALRDFLLRIHAVFDALDETPLTTIAAVHGVVFGGGFELALACDLIVADRLARFGFPELRLGLVPGFGGTARLTREIGSAVVRDLLLTGRSLNASRAHQLGLVSQLAGEGRVLEVARATAAQVSKFDRVAAAAAKRLVKPIPREAIAREIDVFCELFARPEVEAALTRFVHSTDPMPYLP